MLIHYYPAGRLLKKTKSRRTTVTNFAGEHRETCTRMFIAALLIITQNLKTTQRDKKV